MLVVVFPRLATIDGRNLMIGVPTHGIYYGHSMPPTLPKSPKLNICTKNNNKKYIFQNFTNLKINIRIFTNYNYTFYKSINYNYVSHKSIKRPAMTQTAGRVWNTKILIFFPSQTKEGGCVVQAMLLNPVWASPNSS